MSRVGITEGIPSIRMDLFRDVARIAAERLKQQGYEVSNSNPDEVLRDYFNAVRQRISRKPRKVYVAAGFKCPPKYQAAFDAICRKAEAGDDLVPYQSRKVLRLDYNDALLNDWDIHHLHLSTKPDPKRKGLMQGTPDLLYVRVTHEAMYCIGIHKHDTWTDKQLVEVLHQNWPETLQPIYGVRGEDITSEQRNTLRTKRANAAVQMADGTVYTALGGGYTTSGLNIRAVIATDQVYFICKDFENRIRGQIETQSLGENAGSPTPEIEFVFHESGDVLYLREENSGFTVLLLRLLPLL